MLMILAPSSTLPQDETGADALLKDIEVLEIDNPRTAPRESRTRDVDEFFTPAFKDPNGKKMRTCKKCS